MNRFGGRLAAIVFATVFCMGIFTGCSKKEEPVEPDPYEDEYYEDEYYEDEDNDSYTLTATLDDFHIICSHEFGKFGRIT